MEILTPISMIYRWSSTCWWCSAFVSYPIKVICFVLFPATGIIAEVTGKLTASLKKVIGTDNTILK